MNDVANNILKRTLNNINTEDVHLVPCNTTVIIKLYDENPYRYMEKSQDGVILGIESTKLYKSNETGEMEENEEYVTCGKVIAVGPGCKNVQVGEDVFVIKHICTPVPFRKLDYMAISESNIITRIVKQC